LTGKTNFQGRDRTLDTTLRYCQAQIEALAGTLEPLFQRPLQGIPIENKQ
jgi:hypothetical protein